MACNRHFGREVVSKAVKRGYASVQGTVRHNSVALNLGFASADYGYAIDLGLPIKGRYRRDALSLFNRDPEIKAEAVWCGRDFKALKHTRVADQPRCPGSCRRRPKNSRDLRSPAIWV